MAKEFKRVLAETPISKFKKLDIKCTTTKCSEGLHCFSKKEARKRQIEEGVCIDCGQEVVDWHRISKTDISDIKFLVKSLEKEFIRFGYWNSIIEDVAILKAKKRGKIALRISAYKRIKSSIGGSNNYHEGWQTKYAGDDIINYARHATGTCCRYCFEDWYNVKIGTDLTEKQLQFCTELVMSYIDKRVPGIKDEKQKL
jgi:hypothetical protein